MMAFAKLFEREGNQILVKMDQRENGNPEIRVFFEPEGYGVCSYAMAFIDDSDRSWGECAAVFKAMENKEDEIFEYVQKIKSTMI